MGRPYHNNRYKTYYIPYNTQTILPEATIINVHALFLTKGIHHIAVPTIYDGRMLIKNFIDSLHYYQHIGYLTLNQYPQEIFDNTTYKNMYAILQQDGYDALMIELFECDFFVIEYTDLLEHQSWFDTFIHEMNNSTTPVILISA